MQNSVKTILILIFSSLIFSGIVQSQESSSEQELTVINRLTVVQGDVVIQPSISGNTLEAVINTPVQPGDRLATGQDGAVEFKLNDGIYGWLWYESKLELSEVFTNAGQTRVKLWYGAAALSTHHVNADHPVKFEFAHQAIVLTPGTLARVTVESDLTAVYLTVYEGEARVVSGGNEITVVAGDTYMTHSGSGIWSTVLEPGQDDFDNWFIERAKLVSGAYSYSQQLSEETVPAEYSDEASSLYGYGHWITIEGSRYWAPYVASGWVPYHNGHWSYYPSWGWTWIPYEPWGWVACHYGFWEYFFDWGWVWYPSWRWKPHYSHWKYDGRSVHWVAAHPDDPMDQNGVLLKGATPLNSTLQIGIPVEAGQMVSEMNQSKPVRRNAVYSTPPNEGKWDSTLSQTLKPSVTRQQGVDFSVQESPSRTQHYAIPQNQVHQDPQYQRSIMQPVRPRQINRPPVSTYQSPIQNYRQPANPPGYNEINRSEPTLKRPSGNIVKPPSVKPPVSKPSVKPKSSRNSVLKNLMKNTVKKSVKPALKNTKKAAEALGAK